MGLRDEIENLIVEGDDDCVRGELNVVHGSCWRCFKLHGENGGKLRGG